MRAWLLILLAMLVAIAPARAEERIALIVGNAAYSDIGMLPNPGADASLIAGTLERMGFRVTLLLDGNQVEMKKAIVGFGRDLRGAGRDAVGLFFYAGHGIQARDRNYLMPVEAAPVDSADLDLMGVEANWVLRQMESAGNRTNIVILDACRNNPFAASDRNISRGLARIDPPTGSFVAYATAPGSVAVDGDGKNSPFTAALAEAMTQPGLAIEQVFKQVRKEVIRETGGQQTPWDSSSLVNDFYFNAGTQEPQGDPEEVALWQMVGESGDADKVAQFLQAYPEGDFADEARALLKQLMAADPAGSQEKAIPLDPDLTEEELIALAQASPSIQAYANYLSAFPDGLYVDLAKAEIAHLLDQSGERMAAVSSQPTDEKGPLRFDHPLREGDDVVIGWSISQLAEGKPTHAPLEGLPQEVWANNVCADCHAWDKQTLCEQGNFYLSKDESARTRIAHPYGGGFKAALYRWASEGCN